MGIQELRPLIGQLAASGEALGALGAALHLRATGRTASPEVEACLAEVIEALGGPTLLAGVLPSELPPLLALARATLAQSVDFVAHPDRPPGWTHTDAQLLEDQGLASASLPPVLHRAVVPALDDLAARLEAPTAAFLDVGVGVARLAIEMCRLWPALTVVGLDPWEPALTRARQNLADAGLGDRVALRQQGGQDLTDAHAFDLAWLASLFIPSEVLGAAAGRVARALRPGGWLLLGLFAGPGDLGMALARLRTVRSGGTVLSPEEAEALLERTGLREVRTLPRETWGPGLLVAGRCPPA